MRPPPPASACGERLALYGWHTHASASPCQGEWGALCAFVFNGTLKRRPCPGCPASVCRKLFVPCGRIVPVVSPASGRLRALRAFRLRATRSRVLLAPARCAVCALRHAAGTLTRLPERARHWLIALHYAQSHAPTASKCGCASCYAAVLAARSRDLFAARPTTIGEERFAVHVCTLLAHRRSAHLTGADRLAQHLCAGSRSAMHYAGGTLTGARLSRPSSAPTVRGLCRVRLAICWRHRHRPPEPECPAGRALARPT